MNQATLILVAGLPGTGKTTFARALASSTGAEHLNSDMVRDALGMRGKYDPTTKATVYQEMLRRTEAHLAEGRDTIVDATFFKENLRKPYIGLGNSYAKAVRWIELKASEKTIKKRTGEKRGFSEADFNVYQKIKADYEPLEQGHLVLWSDQLTIDEMVGKAQEYLALNHETA